MIYRIYKISTQFLELIVVVNFFYLEEKMEMEDPDFQRMIVYSYTERVLLEYFENKSKQFNCCCPLQDGGCHEII